MVSTHEKSDVVQLYDWSRPYSCSHLRAGNRKSVENAKRIRIMDTTDEYPKGRNSCLVLKLLTRKCLRLQFQFKTLSFNQTASNSIASWDPYISYREAASIRRAELRCRSTGIWFADIALQKFESHLFKSIALFHGQGNSFLA